MLLGTLVGGSLLWNILADKGIHYNKQGQGIVRAGYKFNSVYLVEK